MATDNKTKMPPITMPLFGYAGISEEFTLPSVGDAAIGIVAVTPYAVSINLPENRQFVAAYKKASKQV